MIKLRGRHLITCQEWTRAEIDAALDLSVELKRRFGVSLKVRQAQNWMHRLGYRDCQNFCVTRAG